MPIEVEGAARDDGGTIIYRTTKYEYDQVGNQPR